VSRKLWDMLAILVIMSCLLHGCAPSAGEMNPATASRLQSDADAVVSAVDASRWDAAIAALDQLEADVASARLLAEYPTSAPRRSAPPDKEC
jgi:CubicO group peptidase (beta-lactamase class C family)